MTYDQILDTAKKLKDENLELQREYEDRNTIWVLEEPYLSQKHFDGVCRAVYEAEGVQIYEEYKSAANITLCWYFDEIQPGQPEYLPENLDWTKLPELDIGDPYDLTYPEDTDAFLSYGGGLIIKKAFCRV